MLEAAELGALPSVGTDLVGLEPRLVRPAGNRIDLPAERGYPPRVDDVGVRRDDLEADGHTLWRHHRVDGDDTVRVVELPVELPARDLDVELLLAGRGVRDVLDARQLEEHEHGDHEQHDHGPGRPRELEPRRAVDGGTVLEPRPLASPVLPDERDEERLHEQEDREREDRDEEVARADSVGVGRLRRDGRELREC